MLGLVGAGAYFFTKKDKPAANNTDKKDSEKIDNSKLPQVDAEGKELPSVDDEDKNKVDDGEPNKNGFPNLAELANPLLINNDEYPSSFGPNLLWISDTCQSWAVGKDFVSTVSLPEKYLYSNPTNPNKLTTPAEYWAKVGGEFSPVPWYLNNIPSDIPGRAFAANVIDYWKGNCDISPPRRSQFKTYGEYKIIVSKFASTPLGKLFDYLIIQIQEQMYAAWEKKYPNQALLEIYKGRALDAVIKYPNETAGKQTDIAYAWTFADDPNAPKKLDPKNPKHKDYISAWTRINIEVKNYRGLIKQYGT